MPGGVTKRKQRKIPVHKIGLMLGAPRNSPVPLQF